MKLYRMHFHVFMKSLYALPAFIMVSLSRTSEVSWRPLVPGFGDLRDGAWFGFPPETWLRSPDGWLYWGRLW